MSNPFPTPDNLQQGVNPFIYQEVFTNLQREILDVFSVKQPMKIHRLSGFSKVEIKVLDERIIPMLKEKGWECTFSNYNEYNEPSTFKWKKQG